MSVQCEELAELIEATEANIMDGDSATVEQNAQELIALATKQDELIAKFKGLVNIGVDAAIEKLIELASE